MYFLDMYIVKTKLTLTTMISKLYHLSKRDLSFVYCTYHFKINVTHEELL